MRTQGGCLPEVKSMAQTSSLGISRYFSQRAGHLREDKENLGHNGAPFQAIFPE